ncbi:MAG TPA: efflux RND transporter periplasmic adaptor subunit [Terriglobales bacterium]|nr:efflux RND transporter periplasmic adaptor subunit [Terriglobales bacterium]
MAKRMILMLVLVALAIGGLGYFKFKQVQAAIAAGKNFTLPPTAVTTVVVKPEKWSSSFNVIGTMASVQGVTVSADLPGTVDKIHFESGQWVKQGDVLVELDTRQEKAQLANMEAARDLAHINFGRMKQLVDQGVFAKSDYDNAVSSQKVGDAQVAEVKASIDRKTIRAPFSGLLGIRQVNLGQYMPAGQAIVSLQTLDPIYVNFGVPQQDVSQIKKGSVIRITSDDLKKTYTGRVTAFDAVVNESTRNVQVQATLSNPGGKLHGGMFVQVDISTGADRQVISVPATAINYAPYGDSVFIVGDMKDPKGNTYRGVRQQFVKVAGSRGDQVAIISGLKAGEEVVSSGVFKLRNGASVLVNNKVQPTDNPAPKPEDS